MSKTLFLLTACLGLTLLGACAPMAAPPPAPQEAAQDITIQGINWQWVSVTNQPTGHTEVVPSPEKYTIAFNVDGTLEGQADCNMFFGTYTQEGGFEIDLGLTTMELCGEHSLDREYLELLAAVVAGGPDGEGGLALETPGGEQRMLYQNGGQATLP